ncbi:MAG: creatinine amidohydrolase, partial [Gaiellales bacterium]|nr:creatinine amidohydrolase [Gaiellales bacterium]
DAQAIERRYERLRPAELRSLVDAMPLAYVPIGPLEFHGEHLPTGVDWFEAHGLCLRAAAQSGGVVLPPTYLASGALDLPFTLSFAPRLVHATIRATLGQLFLRGFRAVVVLTGHGPLDLNHMIKRACAEAEAEHPGLAAYGLCWIELNAARLTAPETGDPSTGDHAARIETSWTLELEPELVRLDLLEDDPEATHLGVYGRNPRFTASRELGRSQIDAAASLLAERARGLVAGERPDTFADLRSFVEHGWPERPLLRGEAAPEASIVLHNPGTSSRYISSLELAIDGKPVGREHVFLINHSAGETGVPVRASELAAERGFYVRRSQDATIALGDLPVTPGLHDVALELGLGGVTHLLISEPVEFHEHGGER